jgi:hypothetical protein
VHHGRGDGAVERHHRVLGDAFQELAQAEDLRPVGFLGAFRAVVLGGDRRLQLVLADDAARHRLGERPQAFRDRSPVPQRPVLLDEGDELAGGSGAGRPPRVGEQHQRQQPGHLAVLGEQRAHDASQPRGLSGSPSLGQCRAAAISASSVAAVELTGRRR